MSKPLPCAQEIKALVCATELLGEKLADYERDRSTSLIEVRRIQNERIAALQSAITAKVEEATAPLEDALRKIACSRGPLYFDPQEPGPEPEVLIYFIIELARAALSPKGDHTQPTDTQDTPNDK